MPGANSRGIFVVTLEVTDAAGDTSVDIIQATAVQLYLPLIQYLFPVGLSLVALIPILALLMMKFHTRTGATNKKMMLHRFVKSMFKADLILRCS